MLRYLQQLPDSTGNRNPKKAELYVPVISAGGLEDSLLLVLLLGDLPTTDECFDTESKVGRTGDVKHGTLNTNITLRDRCESKI